MVTRYVQNCNKFFSGYCVTNDRENANLTKQVHSEQMRIYNSFKNVGWIQNSSNTVQLSSIKTKRN